MLLCACAGSVHAAGFALSSPGHQAEGDDQGRPGLQRFALAKTSRRHSRGRTRPRGRRASRCRHMTPMPRPAAAAGGTGSSSTFRPPPANCPRAPVRPTAAARRLAHTNQHRLRRPWLAAPLPAGWRHPAPLLASRCTRSRSTNSNCRLVQRRHWPVHDQRQQHRQGEADRASMAARNSRWQNPAATPLPRGSGLAYALLLRAVISARLQQRPKP